MSDSKVSVLSPCANKAHSKSSKEYEETGGDAFLPTKVAPARVAEKVLRQEFDQ